VRQRSGLAVEMQTSTPKRVLSVCTSMPCPSAGRSPALRKCGTATRPTQVGPAHAAWEPANLRFFPAIINESNKRGNPGAACSEFLRCCRGGSPGPRAVMLRHTAAARSPAPPQRPASLYSLPRTSLQHTVANHSPTTINTCLAITLGTLPHLQPNNHAARTKHPAAGPPGWHGFVGPS
jgi:hypothetical protein